MKRYELRWAALDPARGSEMAKRRPVVIVSLDALNERLPTVTVCPLTSQLNPDWRSRLAVRCADQPAHALQVLFVELDRLHGPWRRDSQCSFEQIRRHERHSF